MIKVIYRCKTDFCDGEAINKEVRLYSGFLLITLQEEHSSLTGP